MRMVAKKMREAAEKSEESIEDVSSHEIVTLITPL
jgi:hypothetical protein